MFSNLFTPSPSRQLFRFLKACIDGDSRTVRNALSKNKSFATYHVDDNCPHIKMLGVYGIGSTGLMIAAERGYRYIVRLLLRAGANPNFDGADAPEKSVHHPLMYATFNGQSSCMSELLKAGAYPNAVSEMGTPLEQIALRYDIESNDAFLFLFQYSKTKLELRTNTQMKLQHTDADITVIRKNFREMQNRIAHIYKVSTNTFIASRTSPTRTSRTSSRKTIKKRKMH
jgi:hypothetical protein